MKATIPSQADAIILKAASRGLRAPGIARELRSIGVECTDRAVRRRLARLGLSPSSHRGAAAGPEIPFAPIETTDELTILESAIATLQGDMTRQIGAADRARVAATLARLAERRSEVLAARAAEAAQAAGDGKAVDRTIAALQLLARRRDEALEAALADAPPEVAARVRAALDLGVVAVDADDEGGADAAHG